MKQQFVPWDKMTSGNNATVAQGMKHSPITRQSDWIRESRQQATIVVECIQAELRHFSVQHTLGPRTC